MKNNISFFKNLSKFPNVKTCVSEVKFGSIREENGGINKRNAESFLSPFKINLKNVIFMKQIHGNNIKIINNSKKTIIENTDGLITSKENIFLCVTTADCLPVVFYDPISKIIGALHVGYKGLLSGIIDNLASVLKKQNSAMSNLIVNTGPAICSSCYSVSFERIAQFKKKLNFLKNYYEKDGSKYFFDLKKTFRQTLVHNGVKPENIDISTLCTKCDSGFFSFRNNNISERFVTAIGMV